MVVIEGTWTLQAAGGNQPTSVLTVGKRACWASLVRPPELMLRRPRSSLLLEKEVSQKGYEIHPLSPIL